MTAMQRTVRLAAVVALAALSYGCAEDGASDDAGAPADTAAVTVPPNGESVEVQALDNSFRPETLEISAGTEVVFTNVGRNDHNIVPAGVEPGETGDWGVATEDFAPKDVYSHVFSVPGTYAYYCSIHGTGDVGMIGTVVVTD